ncbi:MAG: fatty acid desaturase, partial [Blastocatellia bacterium]|nr:fatty acid desaturase [Blastocatellia bacterium]
MSALSLKQAVRFRWDVLLIALALAHGALLVAWSSIAFIGVGLWWNANTVSHNFIHRPFSRSRALNAAFSCYLSLMLGFPQSLWRARHLAHHGILDRHESTPAALDLGSTLAIWGALLVFAPRFTLTVYLPGYLFGLGLCALQGYYEHARGTLSHYGRLYNLLFFNDGYHIEHHAHPGMHWRELRKCDGIGAGSSPYPAVIRWLEYLNLCALERLVLRSPTLQRFVIDRHERAFRFLFAEHPSFHDARRVGIVGGGLFPRTAIILRRLLSQSNLTLIDLSAENLAIARRFLTSEVEYINEQFDPLEP